MPIITLTTDFGDSDSYVAQMKGVILAINASANIVDVTHSIPPQDVGRAAAVMEEIAGVFPPETIHVAVVDPGVGTRRALIAAEAVGQRFLAPDNGLLRPLFSRFPPIRVHRLEDVRFWRKLVSATFHGRDIIAPVAGYWSAGAGITEFGPPVAIEMLVDLQHRMPTQIGRALVGQIESVDAFGNLITNVRQSEFPAVSRGEIVISLGGNQITGVRACYSDQPLGRLVALIGSSGCLEIAINGGNAARTLNLGRGSEVRIEHPPV